MNATVWKGKASARLRGVQARRPADTCTSSRIRHRSGDPWSPRGRRAHRFILRLSFTRYQDHVIQYQPHRPGHEPGYVFRKHKVVAPNCVFPEAGAVTRTYR